MAGQVDSKLLAGGQSLLAAMKLGLMAPARLIALARIPALRARVPGLARMAGHIADAQVRAMGTVGGSLANADPAACRPRALRWSAWRWRSSMMAACAWR